MDDICNLVKEAISYDEYGRTAKTKTTRQVYCKVFGITQSEFYAAAAANLNPEIKIRLSMFEDYEGEKLVEYRGDTFSVIRVYRNSESIGDAIELTLERKVGTMEAGESE